MHTHPQVMTLSQWSGGASWALELQHSAPTHALIWQTRGQSRCIIEGSRYGLGVHAALALPAVAPFALELGAQSYGLVCLVPADRGHLMPDTPVLLRIRDGQTQGELTALLDAMQREQNAGRPFMDEALDAHATALTIWLRRAMIAQDVAEPQNTAAAKLVRGFTALIERDFRSGQPMANYARTLGVTPTHLTRACKQCSGLTAADMLTQRSLHAARTALERGQRPIAQIAAELGFNSAGYFTRFIQQHTGMTPSALRRKARDMSHPKVSVTGVAARSKAL